ncbi:MAG: acetate/propionate family kinase [Candidatus Omnitrophica bacterium]|nr:acetate/propionate family kinase [Candidatus Omnitrophota bacterium]
MHILVFNGGSSSLSYKVFDFRSAREVRLVLKGKAHRVGVKGTERSYIENHWNGKTTKEVLDIPDHKTAACLAAEYIVKNNIPVDAVGHRFVHGGEYFKQSAILDRDSLSKIKKCLPLAPLHNPISFHVINEARRVFADIPHYVVIDSAFHSTIEPRAYRYALPHKVVEKYKFRRFGFHGISYSYVCDRMPKMLNIPSEKLNMIVCHLGTGGASVMAVRSGASIDTSMGFSPNSGLIMSTRSGDIDPAVILYLVRERGMKPLDVEAMLNNKSGLRGISGFSSDITDIIKNMKDPQYEARAALALEMYIQRLKGYIGSYVMALGGKVDALVFTDDIGVGNPFIRQRVCASLGWAGMVIDPVKNDQARSDAAAFIQAASSKVAIVSIPTEEELMICLEGGRILGEKT